METNKTGIGAAVPRKEDHRFLTGRGQFSDDIMAPGTLVAVVLRAPLPHADITGIDVAAARAVPGVALVLTAADLDGDGLEFLIAAADNGQEQRQGGQRPDQRRGTVRTRR